MKMALLPLQVEEAQHWQLCRYYTILQVHHWGYPVWTTAWNGSCTALNPKALLWVVKTAQHITRTSIHGETLQPAVKEEASRIIKVLNQPRNKLFCKLPSCGWYSSIRSCTTSFRNNVIPQARRLLNSWTLRLMHMSPHSCLSVNYRV